MFTRVRSLLHNLTRRRRVERALDDEVQACLDMLTDEKIAAGLTLQEARRAARVEFGGVEQVKEDVRSTRAGALVEQLMQDVRYSVRALRHAPTFTAVAVVTLALGIGANTAIFSVVDAVLLRPLPVDEPERLVALYRGPSGSSKTFSYQEYQDYRAERAAFEAMAAWGGGSRFWFRGTGDIERAATQIVSGNYFDVVGVRAAIGRTFFEDEDPAAGVHPVAVISDSFWRSRFSADPGIAGRSFTLNGHAFTVIGVTPPGFTGLEPTSPPDLWVPIAALQLLEPAWAFKDRREVWLRVSGRLRNGVGVREAQAALQPLSVAAGGAPGDAAEPRGVRIVPSGVVVFDPDERRTSLRIAWILMAVVASVLLIGCANVASLLLARSAARRRELGIRLAIGATRGRVARQVITESLVLAIVGGVAALAVAHWTIDLLVAIAPPATIPPNLVIGIDDRVLAFAALTSLVTGVLFGMAPAWQLSRLDALTVIKATGLRAGAGRGTVTGVRRLLVTAQVALSVVLLVGAALFLRTLDAASAVTPGYDVERVLLVGVDFGAPGATPSIAASARERTLERIAAVPEVEAASFGQLVPFSGSFISRPAVPEDQPMPAGEDAAFLAPYNVVAPDYFRALAAPLRGRDFAIADGANAPRVVIVNETMASRWWPGQEAIGKRLRLPLQDPGPLYEVVGVVQDGKYVALTETQHPFMYLPVSQQPRVRGTLHIRTRGEPGGLAPQVRAALRDAAPDAASYNVITLDALMQRSLSQERLMALLLTVFGVLAVTIAAVGIYGVLAYSVARRTRELGVRVTLGAGPAEIIRLVTAQSATLVGAGLAVGLAASLALTRFVRAFLFGITPTDPVAFGAALLVLLAVALLATSIPALRATRLDPLAALRTD
jgi:predicted permease